MGGGVKKPIIAIPPESIKLKSRFDGQGSFCGLSYSRAITLAGAIPLIMPLTTDEELLAWYLDHSHGLLLIGGGDVNPERYGQKPHPKVAGVNDERDGMEIFLSREARRRDFPVLGICRGIQVINVAHGGTLHQHITGHLNPDPTARAHELDWQGKRMWVNTSHHQAVDRIAPGFKVTARADDDTIEAMELPGARYCRAVQFHPERLVDKVPGCQQLFADFVRATTLR